MVCPNGGSGLELIVYVYCDMFVIDMRASRVSKSDCTDNGPCDSHSCLPQRP